MSTRQREREYARKRHEKWAAHQAAVRARKRRQRVVAGAVLGVLTLVAVVFLVLEATRGDGTVEAASDAAAETPAVTRVVPDPALAEGRTWTAALTTTAGHLTLELDGAAAPQAVASFVTLAQEGFFDGTSCHRLTLEGIYVLQCGDPTGTGTGGPGYTFGPIENAPTDGVYPAGTVAMARPADNASGNGSQFFLVYADSAIPADAAGGYTVMGTITSGMDVLDAVAAAGIVEGTEYTPAVDVTIEGVETQ